MRRQGAGRSSRAAWCFAGTATVLAAFGAARAVGWLGGVADLALLGVAAALTVAALRCGMTTTELGLDPHAWRRGLRWGGGAAALVVGVLVVAALVPATAAFLDDDRARISGGQLAAEVLVGILVTTVLPEELLFRGVLLGAGRRAWGTRWAVVASSALFGVWHVATAGATLGSNAGVDDLLPSGTGAAVAATGVVAATFVAGVVFCWLRLRSGSLVAPVLAHLATNGAALAVAWVVVGG